MAPALSFTAEEAWAVFAGEQASRTATRPSSPRLVAVPGVADAAALLDKYALLRAVRADVTKQLEEVRASGAIGSSLQAELAIKAAGDKYQALASLDDDLKFVFITSQAQGRRSGGRSQEAVAVTPSTAAKCERCWHYRARRRPRPAHPGLCGRCTATCSAAGETAASRKLSPSPPAACAGRRLPT